MTYSEKVKKQIKKLGWISDDEIVSLNTEGLDGKLISISRRDVTLTKALNLIEAGWTALPF